jgi:hypothetical protein
LKTSLSAKEIEVKDLLDEKVNCLVERNEKHADEFQSLKVDQEEKYHNEFAISMELVTILFPNVDLVVLHEADSMKDIVNGKIV